MRSRLLYSVLTAAGLTCLLAHSSTYAQGRGQNQNQGQKSVTPAQPAPRLANGHPDLSGVWMGGGGIAARNLKPGDQITVHYSP